MKCLLIPFFVLTFLVAAAQPKKAVDTTPNYPEIYNWFPDDGEIVGAYFKTGFPVDIRGWHMTDSVLMLSEDTDRGRMEMNVRYTNTRPESDSNSYLREYNRRLSISWGGTLELKMWRTPEESRRIDSVIKLQYK